MNIWSLIGIVIASVLALCGLFFIGVVVLLFVGLNQWSQNK